MPNVLEAAPTGRAKCRACGKTIPKGDLRMGEALPNAYGEGESLSWFHVLCGACARPEAMKDLLKSTPGVPDRDWLEGAVEAGIAHPRLARMAHVERASSGRATCRSCRELIEKGTLRIALHMMEDGRMNPVGTIHAKCAPAYFGTSDLVERGRRLSPELTQADLQELDVHLREGAELAEAMPENEDAAGDAETPGLAKTRLAEPAAAEGARTPNKTGS